MYHNTNINIPDVRKDPETGIMYRVWKRGIPKTVFLLVHGLGAYGGRWVYLADFFLRHNTASYALELRGFGETEGLRGHVASFKVYYNDICRLRDIIRQENPEADIILLGSSMGGLISFVLAALKPLLFEGLICISPAFLSKIKFGLWDYLKIAGAAFFSPRRQFDVPVHAGMCTRDEECREALDNEKREHHIATSAMLTDIAKAEIEARFYKNKLKTRVLFLIAEHDELVSPASSKKIFQKLKVKDKTLVSYPGMYHGLAIDEGREKVFEDILKWIERAPGRGSS